MKALLFLGSALLLVTTQPAVGQEYAMTFFITSTGSGDGANLGGLGGADRHCRALAAAAGSEITQWKAYLSTVADEESPAIDARSRIGTGPWHNAASVQVASSVDDLHSDDNNLTKETVLTEKGEVVNGRGDSPNMHDILTGSNLDGTAFIEDGYNNCNNWTSNGEGNARVGHHDRTGGGANPTSWNSAHNSRGCGQEDLQGTGGDGLFYCFGIAQ
ncbi:MAG: hypothetical protein OEZ54_11110 [Gemmatimonadota bacterium]|nr:hypothetical protein [Gemmatimonadota bacterium]